MRTAGIIAVALSFVSLPARADSKAWTAAKAGLPAEARLVIGLDVATIQKTELFATFFPKFLEKTDATKVIDTMKTACKIDPLAVVQGLVFAVATDQEDGAAYIALSGIDKAKLSSCLQAAAQASDKAAKITLKQDGNITVVSDGKDSRFLGWVTKDVFVVSLHSNDKASLAKWMGGKGALARSEVGKMLAKVNTSAAMWGAGEAGKEVQPGITVKLGYGAVTFAKGNLDADVHAVMGDAGQAKTMASTTTKQLDEAKQAPLLPPAIGTVLKAVSVAAANDEVVIKASLLEKDLLGALAIALGNL